MPAPSASQQRVLDALKQGPLRAHDLARALGIDTSAVRRHLDHLGALGLVESSDAVEGPGRPKRSYRLTAAGRESGPRNYPLLLASLMRKVGDEAGRKTLYRYLEAIAADLAGAPERNTDARRRLDLLLAKYNALGFQAEVAQEGKRTVLVQRNCPFLAVATGDPEAMCQRLDEGIMRTALPGAKVTLDKALAKGDGFCRHILEFTSGRRPAKVQRPTPATRDP